MIVEFCKYGNLSNYLRSKRDDFLVYKVSHKLHDLYYSIFSSFWLQACQQCEQGATVFTAIKESPMRVSSSV